MADAPANVPSIPDNSGAAKETAQAVKNTGVSAAKKTGSAVAGTYKGVRKAQSLTFSRPEMPFLLAGVLALIGGVARERGWPDDGFKAIGSTVVLVILASLTNGTSFAPVVRALGLLMVLGAAMATIPAVSNAVQKKGK